MPSQTTFRVAVSAFFIVAAGLGACGPSTERGTERPTDETERAAAQAEAEAAEQETHDLEGEEAARALMAQWRRANPDRNWIEREQETHTIVEPADNSDLIGNAQGHQYGRVTERDVAIWDRETTRLVTEGSTIFHSADELGSTIAVSCDMCHPDGANTHPETYPKFQVQMGRVALLRDMINWCIEQAVEGEPFPQDDPRLRAIEAYIYAQRKGTELNYGRR